MHWMNNFALLSCTEILLVCHIVEHLHTLSSCFCLSCSLSRTGIMALGRRFLVLDLSESLSNRMFGVAAFLG